MNFLSLCTSKGNQYDNSAIWQEIWSTSLNGSEICITKELRCDSDSANVYCSLLDRLEFSTWTLQNPLLLSIGNSCLALWYEFEFVYWFGKRTAISFGSMAPKATFDSRSSLVCACNIMMELTERNGEHVDGFLWWVQSCIYWISAIHVKSNVVYYKRN